MHVWQLCLQRLPRSAYCLTLALLFTAISILFFPPHIQAQTASSSGVTSNNQPLNLTLSPISLSLVTNPGEPRQAEIKVFNNSPQSEELKVEIGTFTADESGQKPLLRDITPEDTFITWLTVDEPTFNVPPGQSHDILVTFTPPPEAALSYYYTVQISRLEPPKPEGGETAIQGAPAVLILTQVTSPQTKRELELESVSTSPIVEFLPKTITLRIKNPSNIHIAPSGNIFIDGQGQKDLSILSVNPTGNMILPQSTREFEVVWNEGFPVRTEDGINWDLANLANFRIGKYTAHVLLVYDNGERDVPIEAFVDFWVVPFRIIAVLILIPVVPALIVYVIMRWQLQRKTRETNK